LAKCVLQPGEMASQVGYWPAGRECGEPWHRLWRGVVTAQTIIEVQHQH